jgi:hypothetical protein
MLVVASPLEATVYVNGAKMGPTNQPLIAPCGPRFVRLAKTEPDARAAAWLIPGQTVAIPCKSVVEVRIAP